MISERKRWATLPKPFRRAIVIALATALVAGGLYVAKALHPNQTPSFTKGGKFLEATPAPTTDFNLSIPTSQPIPVSSPGGRSEAVLTAPGGSDFAASGSSAGPAFPELGDYVYTVQGTERATAFGQRNYPPEMSMKVHRGSTSSSSMPNLKTDELDFDLTFSPQHEEREIVAYRGDGILFTFEGGSVTFGPVTQTSDATYDPPMLQIPIPLKKGEVRIGKSTAHAPDGSTARVEDWSVSVLRQETIRALGTDMPTWVIRIDRRSEPGTPQQDTRTRTYWLSAQRRIWVKWTETTDSSQPFGPGRFSYHTTYTATLDRIEPL